MDIDLKVIEELSKEFLKDAGADLSALLDGKQVTISFREIVSGSFEQIKSHLPAEAIFVSAKFTGALHHPFFAVFRKEDAAAIAGTVMGMEVEGEFGELELNVISDSAGHMLNTAAAHLGEHFRKKISVTDIQSVVSAGVSFEPPPEFQQNVVVLLYTMNVQESFEGSIVMLYSEALAGEMVALKHGAPVRQEKETKAGEPAETMQQVKSETEPEPQRRKLMEKQPDVQPVRFAPMEPSSSTGGTAVAGPLDLIMDVPLQLTVELGRARKTIKEILELSTGSIVELDKLDGEPVDILANGKLFAKGEVVVIGETFGVRVVEIVSAHERLGKFKE